MNVLDMTISRVSRISMALSLMLLASWVWFNFLTQPQAMNLFVTSPSMFQQVSLGNLRLPNNGALQDRSSGLNVAQLPQLQGSQLQGSQLQLLELDSVEVLSNSGLNRDASQLGNEQLGTPQLGNQPAVTNFDGAAVQGGPAPLLPSAQRQNIMIADLPFLVSAPPVDAVNEEEQIVIAAPSARLTVNPFAPIYVEEEEPIQQRTPVVNVPSNNSNSQNTSSQVRAPSQQVAQPVAEPLQPKIEVGAVPTPRPLLPPPTRQSNLPSSLATGSLATKPSLLSAPIRSSYYDASEVPEPVVIEVPAEVVEVPAEPVEVVAEPVKLDRSRLTGIRMPVAGATSGQSGSSQISSRAYNTANNNNGNNSGAAAALPSVTQAPANPTIAARLPQTAGVRPALSVPALQPIGLQQAQLIGRRNVPVVEAEPVEVVEEVVAPPVPVLRPVQIALRVPEPVVQQPIVQAPVVQEPVIQEPIVETPVVPEVVEVPVVETPVAETPAAQEEVDVIEIPTSQPYIASVSSTLDIAQPVVDTTTVQAVAADSEPAANAADVAGASVVAQFVRDNNIHFTGAILGPVSVAIFKGRMGSFHVPIGEYIPDTDIRLTNVKRHEVELRQGSESHIIYLDVGQ